MIRLLTEIEENCVKPETVLVAYDRMERLLDVMIEEEDTAEILEDAEEECFSLVCHLRLENRKYFDNLPEKFRNMELYQMARLVPEQSPDYNYRENLARLRKDCIRYLAIWHPHPMLMDYNRAYINYSLRKGGYKGYALVGDSYDPAQNIGEGETCPAYNAAWFRQKDNSILLSVSHPGAVPGETRTTVLPFRRA